MKQPQVNKKHITLDKLMQTDAAAVEQRIREFGGTGIIFTAMTSASKALVIPGLLVEAELDVFATIIRLNCLVEDAQVCVLSMGARIKIPPSGESPGSNIGNGNKDREQDVLLQFGESRVGNTVSHRFLPFLRDTAGRFTALGVSQALPPNNIAGRFSRLLPTREPSPLERKAAAAKLATMWSAFPPDAS